MMDIILAIVEWFKVNGADLVKVYLSVIGAASIIVKLTPTTADDAILEKIKNFVAKFIALN
jgi:hypothetical protein